MNLKEVAKEIRDILSKRQKELDLTFEEEKHRYTMKDVGLLDKRVKNIEYYSALTLLEQDTNTLSIKDEFGNDIIDGPDVSLNKEYYIRKLPVINNNPDAATAEAFQQLIVQRVLPVEAFNVLRAV